MGFHEIRFPANLSFGSVGGPERRTEVVTLANGFEERNTPWAHSRRHYDAGVSLRSLDDVEALIAFFEARRGQLFGFRWKDWSDYKSCLPSKVPSSVDQIIGYGDGNRLSFTLAKTYQSGEQNYTRPIIKPVLGSVLVAIDGDPKVETLEFSIDTTTGEVVFPTPPDPGVRITAGFEFDVPVRFDTDRIQTSVASFKAGEVPSVPVLELRV
jgi:uncharacterized protein (TIGR02217 family)